MSLKETVKTLESYATNIFPSEYFVSIEYYEKENSLGGNPDIWVRAIVQNGGIERYDKRICYQQASKSKDSFLNEIRAFFFNVRAII